MAHERDTRVGEEHNGGVASHLSRASRQGEAAPSACSPPHSSADAFYLFIESSLYVSTPFSIHSLSSLSFSFPSLPPYVLLPLPQ